MVWELYFNNNNNDNDESYRDLLKTILILGLHHQRVWLTCAGRDSADTTSPLGNPNGFQAWEPQSYPDTSVISDHQTHHGQEKSKCLIPMLEQYHLMYNEVALSMAYIKHLCEIHTPYLKILPSLSIGTSNGWIRISDHDAKFIPSLASCFAWTWIGSVSFYVSIRTIWEYCIRGTISVIKLF